MLRNQLLPVSLCGAGLVYAPPCGDLGMLAPMVKAQALLSGKAEPQVHSLCRKAGVAPP